MLTYLLFYLLLYPLSLLPLSILYFISRLFYWIIAHIVHYRAHVIDINLKRSFPEKSEKELQQIKKNYYRHLAELAAEMIKMLTISRKNLKKRYSCKNPELVNCFFDQGKSVILVSSHYNNWEWMVLSLDSQFEHCGVGVGAPNSNKVFEKLVNKARTRYGTDVVFADRIRQEFETREKEKIFTAYMMLGDQSPPNPKKSYQTTFLHQPSHLIYGPEYFARKYNYPVLYYQVIKEKKGCYQVELELITDNPDELPQGEITERYVQLLEKTICSEPQYWLWSHKRWKHQQGNYSK